MNAPDRIIPAVGQPFEGGIFAGRFALGEQLYGLIVATADTGELGKTAWNASKKKVAGALSYNDGRANTEAMLAAGSKLAKLARGLVIDGLDDWYLPSRLEALVAFGELHDQDVFERDWYWTSTQYAGDAEFAWCQLFDYGGQLNSPKYYQLRARAVRRFLIR